MHCWCICRCGRIWRHQAQRKALQRSATATPVLPPGADPQTPPAASSQSRPALPAADGLPLLESGALLSALLLNPNHESVRSLAVSLLKELCLGTPHMTIRLLTRLAAMLPQAAAAGQYLLKYCGSPVQPLYSASVIPVQYQHST